MILKLSLKTRKIWMIFTKNKLKNKIQIRGIKYQSKLNPIAAKFFIRGRKLNISLMFITQSYFAVPKGITLNSTYYFIMEIPSKRDFQQQIAFIIYQILTFKTLWFF